MVFYGRMIRSGRLTKLDDFLSYDYDTKYILPHREI